MSFLERIESVLQKNSIKKTNAKINFGYGFNVACLAENQLKQNIYQTNQEAPKNRFTSDFSTYNSQLAIMQPVKFIRQYLNKKTIDNAIKNNPNITTILKENRLELNYSLKNVDSIIMSHLIPSSKTAQKIYTKMGHTKEETDYICLTQAALLHDIGKVFIPAEILDKKGKLSAKERQIIELHNRLSYEILKTTNLSPKVAQLAYEHHDYNRNLKKTQENQALTIADIYCALREKRSYKKPISDIGAKTILYDMGTKGKLDTRYIIYLSE